MEFKALSDTALNGNTRLVKKQAQVRDLSSVEVESTFEVPRKLENKIWAVAEIIYGDVDKAEMLMHFNNLKPHTLKAGTILKLPNLSGYEEAVARNQDKASTEQSSSALTKKSNPNTQIATKSDGRLTFSAKTTK